MQNSLITLATVLSPNSFCFSCLSQLRMLRVIPEGWSRNGCQTLLIKLLLLGFLIIFWFFVCFFKFLFRLLEHNNIYKWEMNVWLSLILKGHVYWLQNVNMLNICKEILQFLSKGIWSFNSPKPFWGGLNLVLKQLK